MVDGAPPRTDVSNVPERKSAPVPDEYDQSAAPYAQRRLPGAAARRRPHMLATPTTGLLLPARLLLPRAIDGQARKPGTGRPSTPPEQGCAWGVSWPVLGDPAK